MEDFTQCSICLENFNETIRAPRLLPCQHTFCSKCLTGLVRGPSSIDCPMCRVNHTIKLDDVPKNRFIIQYMESIGMNNPNATQANAPPYMPPGNPSIRPPMPPNSYSNVPPNPQGSYPQGPNLQRPPYQQMPYQPGQSNPIGPNPSGPYPNNNPSFASGPYPTGPNASGPYPSGTNSSGSYPSGPNSSGSYPSGPGNYPPGAGPYPTIPNPTMPYAAGTNPYSTPNQNYQQSGANNNSGSRTWDDRQYLKVMFDDIDHNHDGQISSSELHEALRRGQPTSEFDPYTVKVILKKYDRNNDDEISYAEFYDLFIELNNQYNEFLDIDTDFSGSIDSRELSNSLRKRGFNLSSDLYNFIFFELSKRSGRQNISFDLYVRVIARFEHLRSDFYNLPQNRNNPSAVSQLENFIRQNFF